MYLDHFVTKATEILQSYEEPVTYLRSRGLTSEDIKTFNIGYVTSPRIQPENSEDYRRFFEETGELRGLRKRIIFPLRNILGNVTGLVVRDMDKKRYTQYFLSEAKATGALFGLVEALPAMRKTRKVFVHEGAFNAVSFAKVFPNTISSLTSFLNEQQFELLKFFVDKIIAVYDKDASGFLGVKKMQERYGERYIDSVLLGEGDANEYLVTMGLERFTKFVKNKVPALFHD